MSCINCECVRIKSLLVVIVNNLGLRHFAAVLVLVFLSVCLSACVPVCWLICAMVYLLVFLTQINSHTLVALPY